MAGAAKTNKFFFSTADLMVGPMSAVKTLNPTDHGIGLVKNIAVMADQKVVDLTTGIMNDVVDQQVNGVDIKASAEVYEYTSSNLLYGLGLDGTPANSVDDDVMTPLQAAVAGAATTCVVVGDVTTRFTAGSWGFIQEGTDTYVHVFKVISSAFAAGNTTITFTGYAVPATMSFSTAAGRIGLVKKIDFNPNAASNYYAVKVAGTAKNSKKPVSIIFPKVRITKGYSLKFAADGFGNMPFEWTPLTPIPTDAGYSSDYTQRMTTFI